MRVRGSVIVITGASSGIGRAAALSFARAGAVVVLVARRAEALETVAEECREKHGAEALPVALDVTDAAAVDGLAQRVVDRFGRIDGWVNNASVSAFGAFQDIPLEDMRRVLDINVMGYVHGCRSALEVMREQRHGVLVNVASVVGVIPQPYAVPYTMSKFAVRALSLALRQEVRLEKMSGVKVCAVLPSGIDTPLFGQAANYSGRKVRAMPPVYAPERVARTIVDLMRVPRREVVVGTAGRALALQYKFAPRLTERALAVQVNRAHLSRKWTAPRAAGNLHSPAAGPGTVHGGFHGRRRTVVRRLATVGMLLALVRLRRRHTS
ncbi:SDR family oxidoreductase [Streptomyces sp. ACA25]|uniref:SDR family oxidoreductase n=1 Tax=Streptomyces sp. ACA25 TaxID=3022596 RepID=UPI00230705EE|nr:SDR family oxidoreductase [Streptomyces sp. ACA25]MDB1089854.1 SDR family oxidoreductase [Streptomyces sp. ACA25]